MKKLALLLVSVVLFASCDLDDDGTQIVSVYTQVTEVDLPEYFEYEESYDLDVTFLLPNACHTALGVDARRGSQTGDEKRDIYLYGVASYDASAATCSEEGEDIEKVSVVTLRIDEEEPYTFYLFTGEVDENNEAVFDVIEIPVGEPADEENPDPVQE